MIFTRFRVRPRKVVFIWGLRTFVFR
uniref:Uncharacterized protein n=1 Tax=Rhizophora mucronata TaxID=61149 RepID=A0A2P2QSP7_RHIMU